MKGSFKIEGGPELVKLLRQLPIELQEKTLPKAPNGAAKLVRDAARKLAPILEKPTPYRKAGTLKRFIRNTSGKRNRSWSSAYVYVKTLTGKQVSKFKQAQRKAGQRVSASQNPDDPFYWRFQEFGTSKMQAANGGRGFIRPAFDENKRAAAEAMKDTLRKGIERAANRLARPRRRR